MWDRHEPFAIANDERNGPEWSSLEIGAPYWYHDDRRTGSQRPVSLAHGTAVGPPAA